MPSVAGMFLIRDLVSPRTWLAFTHHVVGLVIGFLFLGVTLGVAFSAAFVPLGLVSLPILGLMLRFADWLAAGERARFAVLLGARDPGWPADPRRGYRWLLIPRRVTLIGRATWGEIGYALLRPAGQPGHSVAVASLVWATRPGPAHAAAVRRAAAGRRRPRSAARVLRGPAHLVVAVTAGLLLLLAAPSVTRGLAGADAAFARWLLAPPQDLAARVAELEVSRERVVDAAEAERRRIERDLHDGAQQRLVALAMELGRAKAKFGDDVDGARDLVDQAHAQAKAALTELRNLVRGVHPPVLTDRGLDAALSGLAALCPVPVDVQVDVPVRPKPAVEAVAYFVVAEALTNVAKHSRASHASVFVEGHGFPGTLTVVISDDGIGGADPGGGGLSGLADRVAGVDGALSVESPSGGPTIISAVLPCG